KDRLKRHCCIHTNKRPYRCSTPCCDKSFTQILHLNRHNPTHTGEKSYQCQHSGCGGGHSFRCSRFPPDPSSLARHRHVHTGKR
ncbi:uncharacterized protein GLRG_11620, partial [Colletotrichum graminicola M1.001]